MSAKPNRSSSKAGRSRKTARNLAQTTKASHRQAAQLVQRPEVEEQAFAGRPTKFTPELADEMLEAICNGASLTDMLRDNGVGTSTFYRWMSDHEGFRQRYEEATYIRHRTFGEKLIGLSIKAGYTDNVRGVLAEAHLLEKGLAHITGGANSWINRRQHGGEGEEVPQAQITPEFKITFGRPDKPPGWKVTDDMPELGELEEGEKQQTVLDIRLEREKFMRGE